MDCDAARRLLGQGVVPGGATPQRAALGFHLAQCPACREYRASNQRLLAALLEQPARAPAPPARPASPVRWFDQWRWPHVAGVGAAALLLALALLVIAPAFSALITIRNNIQAMMLPAAARTRVAPLGIATPAAAARGPSGAGVPVTAAVATVRPVARPTGSPLPSATPVAATPSATAGHPAHPTSSPGQPHALPTRTITPVPLGHVDPATGVQPAQTALPRGAAAAQPASGAASAGGEAAITVLLLGSDRRPDETGPARADAIVLARIEPSRQRVALLSLPRDLLVDIPGYGRARINAATAYGELNAQPGGGTELARQTISNLVGVPIDYVVQVDFQGFIGAIDAIGGIDVTVPTELYDPAYPTMDYGYTAAHFLPGPQHMDGATALMYSRIRHMDSDFQRLQRQQSVLVGVLERLRAQNVLEQVQSIAAITTALREYVQTDMPEDRLVRLAWALRNLAPESVERYSLDADMVAMNVVPGDPYAEVALPGAIEGLVRQWLGQSAP